MAVKPCFLTIVARMPLDPDWSGLRESEVEALIDQLGNPAPKEIRDALDLTEIVHFLSLSVIRATLPNEHSHLVLEASADGNASQAIAAICKAIGPQIFPVFARACDLERSSQLHGFLRAKNRSLSQFWRPFGQLIGLPFAGVGGMTVSRIRAERDAVGLVRRVIDQAAETDSEAPQAAHLRTKRPLHYLELARQAARTIQTPDWGRGKKISQSAELPFVDRDDAPWLAEKADAPYKWWLLPGVIPAAVLALALTFVGLFGLLNFSPNQSSPDQYNAELKARANAAAAQCQDYQRICSSQQLLCQVREQACAWAGALQREANGATEARIPPILADAPFYIVTGAMTLATAIVLTLALFAVAGLRLYRALRHSEARNLSDDADPEPAMVAELLRRENVTPAHNHMISVTEIIPEQLRREFTLPFAMRVIKTEIKRGRYRQGFLANIGTIHFARWVVMPRTNKLIFFSNYDGSWESYLEDFITKAAEGLTGIWSNCAGFPSTENLFFEGAKDGDRFKRWARRSMVPTRFWYSAYPNLTAQQIRTNAIICDGLRRITMASDADAWLELFDSIPRPTSALELEEIQGLVFSGLKKLKQSRCLVLRFGDEDKAKLWVQELLETITFSDQKPGDSATFVAFTAAGLAKLGLSEEASIEGLDGGEPDPCPAPGPRFPPAFVLGMNNPERQRILGDTEDSAPAKWSWGGCDGNTADAVLLLYGKSESALDFEAVLKRLAGRQIEIVKTVETTLTMENVGGDDVIKEPFQFADGISQPIVRGLSSLKENELHVVEPGEIVLGYRDNRGFFPPTPQVAAYDDPNEILPGLPASLPRRYPQFRGPAAAKYSTRDFGRNGTFLVVRQLQQDVKAFETWTAATAAQRNMEPSLLAAKTMGRWPDGSSLVKYPHAPEGDRDNDFLYGRDDPQGFRAPFGSHIRRANPRDSLDPENKTEIAIVNRHRMLRRGRPYKDEDGSEGILFLALNADIERQYEFVQQNWINAPSHHGLQNERDPIAGHTPGVCSFSMPDAFAPKVCERQKPFVTVRGGGYFFLPSRSALRFLAQGKTAEKSLIVNSAVTAAE